MDWPGIGSHIPGNTSAPHASIDCASSRSDLSRRRFADKDTYGRRLGSTLAQRLICSPLPVIKCDDCPGRWCAECPPRRNTPDGCSSSAKKMGYVLLLIRLFTRFGAISVAHYLLKFVVRWMQVTRYSISFVSFLARTSATSQHPFSASFFSKLQIDLIKILNNPKQISYNHFPLSNRKVTSLYTSN